MTNDEIMKEDYDLYGSNHEIAPKQVDTAHMLDSKDSIVDRICKQQEQRRRKLLQPFPQSSGQDDREIFKYRETSAPNDRQRAIRNYNKHERLRHNRAMVKENSLGLIREKLFERRNYDDYLSELERQATEIDKSFPAESIVEEEIKSDPDNQNQAENRNYQLELEQYLAEQEQSEFEMSLVCRENF